MATPQDLLSSLARAYSLTETRSTEDPEYVDVIQEVRKEQAEVGWIVVRVGPDGFTVGGEVVQDVYGEFGDFLGALGDAGVKEIRLQGILAEGVLEDFLRRLHPSHGAEGILPSSRFRGLEGEVGLSFHEAQGGLPGMVGGIQDLFPASITPEESQTEESQTQEVTLPAQGPLAAVVEDTVAATPLSQDLMDLAKAYLESRGEDRVEMEGRIRAGAQELSHDRDLSGLCAVVELLLEGPEGDSEEDRADEEALRLARELTTPAVASHLVAQLGSTRDETERARLVRVTSRVGREGALALTDALGESRDRFQRRAYMDAMAALGPLGLEMAQEMVEDPRWFVVRNGVALLGELGGEDAVTHLTATLANEDSRVRREAVLSLAKVGGRDAELLVLGMLEDADPDVRAKTCRALGVLKPARGFRPLLGLLKDESLDVQVECLQALGRIGDSAALPAIEKRAIGGMLSRPSREVRIAAFRALAGIGTTGAIKALRKGAKDPDEGVRTVVRALYIRK